MGNIILRIQAASNVDKEEILSINGTRKFQSEFDYFIQADKTIKIETTYKKLLQEPTLQVYQIRHKHYLILSNFAEKDVVQRRISYSANVEVNNNENVLDILKKEALLYGYSLRPQDEQRIRDCAQQKIAPVLIASICIIVILVIVLLTL